MVNNAGPVPPHNEGPKKPDQIHEGEKSLPGKGGFAYKKGREFLGMHFTAKQWNKLMDIMMRNMNQYIQKTFQRMAKKLKKDWKRSRGEE